MANSLEALRKETSNGSAQAVRDDLRNLKENASELKDDLLHAGGAQFEDAKKELSNQMKNAEQYVRKNPGQSIAIAFAVGAVASLILGGRR